MCFYLPVCCYSYGKGPWRKFHHEDSNWRCSKQCCLTKITISYWLTFNNKVQKLWMSLHWKILNVDCIPNFLILYGDFSLVMAGSWVFMSCSGDNAKKKIKNFSYFWYGKKAFVLNQQQTHCNVNVGLFPAHSQPVTSTEVFTLMGLYWNTVFRRRCCIDIMGCPARACLLSTTGGRGCGFWSYLGGFLLSVEAQVGFLRVKQTKEQTGKGRGTARARSMLQASVPSLGFSVQRGRGNLF